MSKFDIANMLRTEQENIYFFPQCYFSALEDDIMSLNAVIENTKNICGLYEIDNIERKNIKIKPNSDSVYYFSVMIYTAITPKGHTPKYPQEVTVFAYEDMEQLPYWHGRIYYLQNGIIGKGELIYRIPYNYSKKLSSIHITFSSKFEIKKVYAIFREGGVTICLYPQ